MLPGEDGLSLCRTLRAKSTSRSSSHRQGRRDRPRARSRNGATITCRSVRQRELIARIRAVLRRGRQTEPWRTPQPIRLRRLAARYCGPELTRDTASRCRFRPANTPADWFVERPQRLLTREQLLDWRGAPPRISTAHRHPVSRRARRSSAIRRSEYQKDRLGRRLTFTAAVTSV